MTSPSSISSGGRSLGDVAARGTGVTLGLQAVRFVLQTISLVLLARLLTPAEFGLVAMVTAITGAADLVRDFGLSLAAVQAKELSDAERTNLFWANLGIGTACCAVLVAATPLVVDLYGEPRLAPIVLTVAGVFVLSGATTQFRAELSRSMRFLALSGADIAAQAVGIGTAVTLALLGLGYWAIVAQLVVVAGVTLVCAVAVCRWRPGWPRRGVSIRRFFRFGGGVLGTQLLAYVTKNIDNVAVGAWSGAAPLGLYSRGYQLLMVPLSQINAPLTTVALPVLARVQDDDAAYRRYLGRAQLVGGYVTATALALIGALAAPLVELLFGPRWAGVAPILALLAVGGVFRAVSQICYWIYLSRDRTVDQLRLYLVLRPIMVLVILAGVPWGPVGVAATCSVAYLVEWLASLWHVGRVTGVDRALLLRNALRPILLVCLPAAAVARLATVLVTAPAAVLLLVGLAAAALTIAAVALIVPAVRTDLTTVARFARRAVGRGRVRARAVSG